MTHMYYFTVVAFNAIKNFMLFKAKNVLHIYIYIYIYIYVNDYNQKRHTFKLKIYIRQILNN